MTIDVRAVISTYNSSQLKGLLSAICGVDDDCLKEVICMVYEKSSHFRVALQEDLGTADEVHPDERMSTKMLSQPQGTPPIVSGNIHTHLKKVNSPDTDEDNFGLSSGDEAELLKLPHDYKDIHGPNLKKRKSKDELGNELKRSRGEDSPLEVLNIARNVLKQRFGMRAFRLQQEQAICRLLQGQSAVVVFPTGGGKSLCYQLPALCFKELDRQSGIRQDVAESGITLVVSPLIALMKDQVDALKRRGISAAVLDSSKTQEEYRATVDLMRNGLLDILYCAPERLNNEGFIASMSNVRGGIRLLAVDEAHCISEWGHAFRPDYLKVARFAREIQAERVVCLTATATAKVADDVRKAFDIPKEGLFRTSSYRPNLRLHAQSYQTKKQSYPKLRKFLQAHPGPTIIYVTLQKQSEELATQLQSHGFNTSHFHAGMNKDDKIRCQDTFMASKDLIVVATIAFGMGIDKSNIRNVIHYDIPRSLEGYSQEIGRAGRDDKPSQCMLYLCAEDLHLRESFARGDLPSKSSVTDLLNEIFSTELSKDPIPVLEVNHYNQSRTYDIKPTVLSNIYAQLELRFNLIRATTPKYTKYSYTQLRSLPADNSAASKAIVGSARKAKTLWHIDIDDAIQSSGLSRVEIVTKLNTWHDEKAINLTTAGVINVYRVMNKLPSQATERKEVLNDLYRELELRELQELERMKQVTDLITGNACFSKTLAEHFGDRLPNELQQCGQCTWCETGAPVEEVSPPNRAWDSKAFHKVLEACPERDDARYLARVAFGISSPRVTGAKLSKDPVFGSMEDHDFMSLYHAFANVCDGKL